VGGEGTVMRGWGDPAAERDEHSGAWLHVPARGKLTVVILSSQPVRYVGHWVGGRMRRCTGRLCVWHEKRIGQQVRYCFSVLDAETRAPGLLEVGAACAQTIWETSHREGRLRGLTFALRKEGQRDRGRILAVALAPMMALDLLPVAEEIEPHLARQYDGEAYAAQGQVFGSQLPDGEREEVRR
jgi:hypothetical protein